MFKQPIEERIERFLTAFPGAKRIPLNQPDINAFHDSELGQTYLPVVQIGQIDRSIDLTQIERVECATCKAAPGWLYQNDDEHFYRCVSCQRAAMAGAA